jgi:hypothetical protein
MVANGKQVAFAFAVFLCAVSKTVQEQMAQAVARNAFALRPDICITIYIMVRVAEFSAGHKDFLHSGQCWAGSNSAIDTDCKYLAAGVHYETTDCFLFGTVIGERYHSCHGGRPLSNSLAGFRRENCWLGTCPAIKIGVAVMTDTDNTRTTAAGEYADIFLECSDVETN